MVSGDCDPGEKIQAMLVASGGDFRKVEMMITKKFQKEQVESTCGAWVTSHDLEKRGWNSQMVTCSRSWAQANGLLRTSQIHGEEEWRIPLDSTFAVSETWTDDGSYYGRCGGGR